MDGQTLVVAFVVLMGLSTILNMSAAINPGRMDRGLKVVANIVSLLPGAVLGWNAAQWPDSVVACGIGGIVSWAFFQGSSFLFSLPYRKAK